MGNFYFLNLQYWFCFFYSLFGGKCIPADQVTVPSVDVPSVSLDGATTTITEAGTKSTSWFFGLFSSGGGVESTSTAVATTHTGFIEGLIASSPFIAAIAAGLGALWTLFSALSYTISGMLFLSILGAAFGLAYIRYRELSLYGTLPPAVAVATPAKSHWKELLGEAMSTDPKRWREGILAADIMLGELLERLGYQGETTADKMRGVPEGAFVTLPAAWEAHRVRNFVSTRSSDFILTQREAFRVMKLYEQVFEEFDFI